MHINLKSNVCVKVCRHSTF